jgi:hypothetical protein
MHFRNTPLVAIVILGLITPLVCSGASYAALDYSELWRESDTIVVGTVTSITSEGGVTILSMSKWRDISRIPRKLRLW